MNAMKPVVGQWYRGVTNELFEVVAVDEEDETIEIQYFDGTVTEMDFDSWNEQLLDHMLDAADAPEDWSGAVDVEAEDLNRDFEDNARSAWSSPQDRSRRRGKGVWRSAMRRRSNAGESLSATLTRGFGGLAGGEFIQRTAQDHQKDQARHRTCAGHDEEVRPADHRHQGTGDGARHVPGQHGER
jgi:hypothetical protein